MNPGDFSGFSYVPPNCFPKGLCGHMLQTPARSENISSAMNSPALSQAGVKVVRLRMMCSSLSGFLYYCYMQKECNSFINLKTSSRIRVKCG